MVVNFVAFVHHYNHWKPAAITMQCRRLTSFLAPPSVSPTVVACLFMIWNWPTTSNAFSMPPRIGNHRPYHSQSRLLDGHKRVSPLQVQHLRDADFMEMMIGGERYEMVPLPDGMVDTTVFVGNLCEFCTDDDLSQLFQSVSVLNYIPACVARKPNMASLQYGFVAFPTVEEKEAAILRFDGLEWRGRRIKVESIRDHPTNGRVRVPERMVAYVSGAVKKTPDGRTNTLRRISRDDVERLSRGQPAKKKGSGSRNVPHRLNDVERQELNRAARRGYVTLNGTGYRRGRKGSPLANIHRQWCDAREKPQIILCKASGGRSLDNVIVDLSPLRLQGLFDDADAVADFMVRWKTEILTAATNAGMKLRSDYVEDNTEEGYSVADEDDQDDEEDFDSLEYVTTLSADAWATQPIWKLPVISIGVFEGDRQQAKSMTQELASLWEIPETLTDGGDGPSSRREAGARHGGKTKTKTLSHHRQRNGDW